MRIILWLVFTHRANLIDPEFLTSASNVFGKHFWMESGSNSCQKMCQDVEVHRTTPNGRPSRRSKNFLLISDLIRWPLAVGSVSSNFFSLIAVQAIWNKLGFLWLCSWDSQIKSFKFSFSSTFDRIILQQKLLSSSFKVFDYLNSMLRANTGSRSTSVSAWPWLYCRCCLELSNLLPQLLQVAVTLHNLGEHTQWCSLGLIIM